MRYSAAAAADHSRRVFHVITKLAVGGAQETALRCASGLAETGYDVVLVSGPEHDAEGSLADEVRRRDIELLVVPSLRRAIRPHRDLAALWMLVALFRRERPTIVHTHSSKAGVLGRLAARIAGVPFVVHTVHGWSFNESTGRWGRRLAILLERALARMTDVLVVVTPRDADKGLRCGIGRRSQYRVVRSGLDLSEFRASAGRRARARGALGIPHDARVVGCVTRLAVQKDPLTMLRAWAEIAGAVPGVRFVIVGDGPLRREVEAELDRSGIAERTLLLGVRRDVAEVLASFDVFVLTSRWEGLPRAVIEAMAAGVPVVATDVDGVAEVIDDRLTGRLVPPGNAHAMASVILELFDDGDESEALAQRASARVATFDTVEMVGALRCVYEELLDAVGEPNSRRDPVPDV